MGLAKIKVRIELQAREGKPVVVELVREEASLSVTPETREKVRELVEGYLAYHTDKLITRVQHTILAK